MKQILLIIAALLCLAALPASAFTSKSMLFADSYMLRAEGCDANYWNPALLNPENGNIWLPVLNSGMFLGNNSINIDLYNYIMERDYLDDEAKQHILDAIDDRLAFDMGGNFGIFGITMGNVALTSSVHLAAKAAFDEQYLQLLLYGNGDGTQVYEFEHEDNYFDSVSYMDLTLGMGDIRLPLPEAVPDIKVGFAASLLGGIGNARTEELHGYFSSDLDGLNVRQDVLLRTGAAGGGFKGLIGLYSEPIPNLFAGVTLDNIFGFLKWGLVREEFQASFEVDSLYAIDISDDDFYTWDYEQRKTDPFTTKLPMELRAAALFHTNQVSLSVDYVKGFGSSPDASRQGRFSLGAELTPLPILPIHLGYCLGNDIYPWRTSYGIGLDLKFLEFGLGIQSIESILPGTSSKGISFASYFNIRL